MGTIANKLSIELNDIPYIDSDRNIDDEKIDCSEKENLLINQELSSSQSSINSSNAGAQELTLDLTLSEIETPVKRKLWKSPDQVRSGYVKTIAKHFEGIAGNISGAQSVPDLSKNEKLYKKSKSSEDINDKLTEEEAVVIFQQLQEWSTFGSSAKTTLMIDLTRRDALLERKFKSEMDLSQKSLSPENKSKSESYLLKDDFDSHNCSFKNCIFKLKPDEEVKSETKNLKGILKNTEEVKEYLNEGEKIVKQKPFNCTLVRCDSLDSINKCQKIYKTHLFPIKEFKKFPESYIVTKRSNKKYASELNLQFCNCMECKRIDMANRGVLIQNLAVKKLETPSPVRRKLTSPKRSPKKIPKIVYVHKKIRPKTWKSCSDIVHKRKVKKCCKFAKKTCPILKISDPVLRDTKSCASIVEDMFDSTNFEDNYSKKTY